MDGWVHESSGESDGINCRVADSRNENLVVRVVQGNLKRKFMRYTRRPISSVFGMV